MITHPLVRRSRISHEVHKDGSVITVLHVEPTSPGDGTKPQQELVTAIVEHMKKHPDIDRADVN